MLIIKKASFSVQKKVGWRERIQHILDNNDINIIDIMKQINNLSKNKTVGFIDKIF